MQSKDVASSAVVTCCPRSPWIGLGRQDHRIQVNGEDWVGTKWPEKESSCEWRFSRSLQMRTMVQSDRYLGVSTSSLPPIFHPISVYTFCSQQPTAVSDHGHLLLSNTSNCLSALAGVGNSQVGQWCPAFLCSNNSTNEKAMLRWQCSYKRDKMLEMKADIKS